MGGYVTYQLIVSHIKVLQLCHIPNGHWKAPCEEIGADIKNSELCQKTNAIRDATSELVIKEDKFIRRGAHGTNGGWYTSCEIIVSQDND